MWARSEFKRPRRSSLDLCAKNLNDCLISLYLIEHEAFKELYHLIHFFKMIKVVVISGFFTLKPTSLINTDRRKYEF